MTQGRSVRVYLPTGSATGLRYAEIVNWTGQVVACPRSRFSGLRSWDEIKRPGVYFLLAGGEPASRGCVYIGEAENVYQRLVAHVKDKDFWNEVVTLTSKDECLTTAHIKYLESRFVALAEQADRCDLENRSAPQLPLLPRADVDAMEEFIANTRVLLGTLGHRLLEPVAASCVVKLAFRFKDLTAYGLQTDEGFLVLKGSDVVAEYQPSTPTRIVSLIERAREESVLTLEGDNFQLRQDYLFSSPSAAACFVSGSSRNGRDCWKDQEGRSLKELEDSLLVEGT